MLILYIFEKIHSELTVLSEIAIYKRYYIHFICGFFTIGISHFINRIRFGKMYTNSNLKNVLMNVIIISAITNNESMDNKIERIEMYAKRRNFVHKLKVNTDYIVDVATNRTVNN